MNGPSRVERLGTEKIGKLLLEMSSQTTLSLLVYAIYSFTDTYFLSVGINSLVAAGASIIRPIVYMLGATDSVAPYAIEYGRIIFLVAITSTGYSAIVRADGNVRYSTAMWMIPVSANIVLCWLFIIVLHMGVSGAALSALDPLGLPVATQVVSGEQADDRLYLPAIAQVSQSLNAHGLLYVGDCKMAALDTRASLAAQQDFYLCPLAAKQMPEEVLDEYLQPVWAGEQPLTPVWREREAGKPEQIAEGYERRVTLSREVAGKTINWTERQLIVRSSKLAQASTQALHARVAKAQAELEGLTEHICMTSFCAEFPKPPGK